MNKTKLSAAVLAVAMLGMAMPADASNLAGRAVDFVKGVSYTIAGVPLVTYAALSYCIRKNHISGRSLDEAIKKVAEKRSVNGVDSLDSLQRNLEAKLKVACTPDVEGQPVVGFVKQLTFKTAKPAIYGEYGLIGEVSTGVLGGFFLLKAIDNFHEAFKSSKPAA